MRASVRACERASVRVCVRASLRACVNSHTIDTFRVEKGQERGLEHLNLHLDAQHHECQGCVYVCVSACP